MKTFRRLFALFAVLSALVMTAAPAAAQFNAFKEPSSGGSGAISGPDLKATADKFEGGKISVGATAFVVATFTNNGSSPVSITGINLYPSSTVSAEVNLNKCAEAPLPPEAVCAITVAVSGLQIGSWRVEILLDHDGRTRLATAAMSGEVGAGATESEEKVKDDIVATPPDLDFGSSAGGVPSVRAVLLRNRTSDTVDLKNIRLDAPEKTGLSLRHECPASLRPGESCIVNITWTPVATGVSEGVLIVDHSAKSSVTKIDIKGDYTPDQGATAALYPDALPDKGLLVADMDMIDFGTGITGVAAMTLSLVNRGSADLTLSSIGLAGSDNGISLSRDGCRGGRALKPSEACVLTINWVPSRAGTIVDDLRILHTGARGVLVLPIRGTADMAATRASIPMRRGSANPPPFRLEPVDSAAPKGKDGAEPEWKDDSFFMSDSGMTPVLDGYTVTSHSSSKAVINGPVGSLVVRDGEEVVVSGTRWMVTIVSTGVILTADGEEVLLVFDRALKPISPETATPSSTNTSTSSSTTTGTTSSTSTTGTATQ